MKYNVETTQNTGKKRKIKTHKKYIIKKNNNNNEYLSCAVGLLLFVVAF